MSSYFAHFEGKLLEHSVKTLEFPLLRLLQVEHPDLVHGVEVSPKSCAISLRAHLRFARKPLHVLRIICTGRIQNGTAAKNMKSITTCPFCEAEVEQEAEGAEHLQGLAEDFGGERQ